MLASNIAFLFAGAFVSSSSSQTIVSGPCGGNAVVPSGYDPGNRVNVNRNQAFTDPGFFWRTNINGGAVNVNVHYTAGEAEGKLKYQVHVQNPNGFFVDATLAFYPGPNTAPSLVFDTLTVKYRSSTACVELDAGLSDNVITIQVVGKNNI